MSNKLRTFILSLPVLMVCCASAFTQQTTAFTYQGRLTDGGNPANGNYDLQFALFDGPGDSAAQIAAMPPISGALVTAGIFTVQLDFGAGAFPGANRFLQISVRHNSNEAFVPLTPRQPITSTPYAIRSLSATGADGMSSACVGCILSSHINSVDASKLTGTIPSSTISASSLPAGSKNYIQNSTSFQPDSNFNISGDGTVFGTLSGGTVSEEDDNSETRFSLLFLGTAPDFILIALCEFFQDGRTVKRRTAVRCQHAADHQLISEHLRLRSIVISGTFRVDSHLTQTPEHGAHQGGLATQAAPSPKHRFPVAPYPVTDFSELL